MDTGLLKRVCSSFLLAAVTAAAVLLRPLFVTAIVGITALGLYEFFTMLEHKGISIFKYVGIGIGVIIPLSIMFNFELTRGWELAFVALAMISLIVMQFKRRQNSGTVVGISVTLFGIMYVSWLFSFLVRIRQIPAYGAGMVAAVLLITKAGDIGAYLVGSRYGKTPLVPRISPKKTVEGAVGGLVFSVCAGWASRWFMPPEFSFLHLGLMGAVLGILGQLGDLSESLMKRDCNLKDSAGVIPGIGGVLDLIDSVLFTAPVFYLYVTLKTFTF